MCKEAIYDLLGGAGGAGGVGSASRAKPAARGAGGNGGAGEREALKIKHEKQTGSIFVAGARHDSVASAEAALSQCKHRTARRPLCWSPALWPAAC